MRTLPLLLSLLSVLAAPRAQIEIAPPESAGQALANEMRKLDLPGLRKKLASDREWYAAARELARRAIDDEMAVVELTVEFWKEMEKDPLARERGFVVVAEINRRNWMTQRRARLDEGVADLKDALQKAKAAAGKGADALRTLETLERKLAQVEKTIADLDEEDPEFGNQETMEIEAGDLGDGVVAPPVEKGKVKEEEGKGKGKGKGKDDTGGKEAKKERKQAEAAPAIPERRGDLSRVPWIRPFRDALAEAERTGRVILCKPILGGSNTPDPEGVPCGGKHDCEGSW